MNLRANCVILALASASIVYSQTESQKYVRAIITADASTLDRCVNDPSSVSGFKPATKESEAYGKELASSVIAFRSNAKQMLALITPDTPVFGRRSLDPASLKAFLQRYPESDPIPLSFVDDYDKTILSQLDADSRAAFGDGQAGPYYVACLTTRLLIANSVLELLKKDPQVSAKTLRALVSDALQAFDDHSQNLPPSLKERTDKTSAAVRPLFENKLSALTANGEDDGFRLASLSAPKPTAPVDSVKPPTSDPVKPPTSDPVKPPTTDAKPPTTETKPPTGDPVKPPTDPVKPPTAETKPPTTETKPPASDPVKPPTTDTKPPTDPTKPPANDPVKPPANDPVKPPTTDTSKPTGTEQSKPQSRIESSKPIEQGRVTKADNNTGVKPIAQADTPNPGPEANPNNRKSTGSTAANSVLFPSQPPKSSQCLLKLFNELPVDDQLLNLEVSTSIDPTFTSFEQSVLTSLDQLGAMRMGNGLKYPNDTNAMMWIRKLSGKTSAWWKLNMASKLQAKGHIAKLVPFITEPSQKAGTPRAKAIDLNKEAISKWFENGQASEAMDLLMKSANADPTYYVPMWNAALLAGSGCNWDYSIKLFTRAIERGMPPTELEPTKSYIAQIKATQNFLTLPDGSQRRLCDEALEMSLFLARSGAYHAALNLAGEVVMLDDTNPEPFLISAWIASRCDQMPLAKLSIQEALSRDTPKTTKYIVPLLKLLP